MSTTAKVSVAVGRGELEWARKYARKTKKSLSSVVTEALASKRRQQALEELVDWMGEGQPPVTDAEMNAARRELRAPARRK